MLLQYIFINSTYLRLSFLCKILGDMLYISLPQAYTKFNNYSILNEL